MKTEHLTLIAAIVAASASIAGVLFNQRGALDLEREKWAQARADDARKTLRATVTDYAKDLSSAQQRAEWLSWAAQYDPRSLSVKVLATYDTETQAALPRIAAHRVLLAAQDRTVHKRLEPVVMGYYRVDECIAKAAVTFRRVKSKGVQELAACQSLIAPVSAGLVREFSAALSAQGDEASR